MWKSILLTVLLITATVSGWAKTIDVSPQGELSSISAAIDSAEDGDTIRVSSGVYTEHLTVDKSIALVGLEGPVIDGGGRDTVVTITSPGVTFKGFTVRGSGLSLNIEHGGVVLDSAPGSVIENNRLEDVLFGIYLKNSPNSVIRNNRIYGKELSLPERGDGIRLWYSSDTEIVDNHIVNARDLVMWWSSNTLIKRNRVEKGRYGLHYMYSNHNLFEDNVFVDNYVGGFLMYSKGIRFHGNVFARNQGPATGYGIGFKDLDDIEATRNLIIDNRIGMYLDNSPNSIDSWNRITDNMIAFNDIGVSFMPSIERNAVVGNSFIDNTEQVQVRGGGGLTGNKWSESGGGNYWSDYRGYDEDSDGVGELPYVAESLFEELIDTYPNLRIFIHSPVASSIELASRAFPVLKPEPKVKDDYPLTHSAMLKELGVEHGGFSGLLLVLSLAMIAVPAGVYLTLVRRA